MNMSQRINWDKSKIQQRIRVNGQQKSDVEPCNEEIERHARNDAKYSDYDPEPFILETPAFVFDKNNKEVAWHLLDHPLPMLKDEVILLLQKERELAAKLRHTQSEIKKIRNHIKQRLARTGYTLRPTTTRRSMTIVLKRQ